MSQRHAWGHALHALTAEALNMRERRLGYNEAAAKRSWKAMTGFLAETIGGVEA
jgi:dienelactone hydrolase